MLQFPHEKKAKQTNLVRLKYMCAKAIQGPGGMKNGYVKFEKQPVYCVLNIPSRQRLFNIASSDDSKCF